MVWFLYLITSVVMSFSPVEYAGSSIGCTVRGDSPLVTQVRVIWLLDDQAIRETVFSPDSSGIYQDKLIVTQSGKYSCAGVFRGVGFEVGGVDEGDIVVMPNLYLPIVVK